MSRERFDRRTELLADGEAFTVEAKIRLSDQDERLIRDHLDAGGYVLAGPEFFAGLSPELQAELGRSVANPVAAGELIPADEQLRQFARYLRRVTFGWIYPGNLAAAMNELEELAGDTRLALYKMPAFITRKGPPA